MLRRYLRNVNPGVTAGLPLAAVRQYRYQEFEMSKTAQEVENYPMEVPNTSYFGQFQLNLWQCWGWGREETWFDTQTRRYETTWNQARKFFFAWFVWLYILPLGIPSIFCSLLITDYGDKPYMSPIAHQPFDNHYIEYGMGSGLEPEWDRHIHSSESF